MDLKLWHKMRCGTSTVYKNKSKLQDGSILVITNITKESLVFVPDAMELRQLSRQGENLFNNRHGFPDAWRLFFCCCKFWPDLSIFGPGLHVFLGRACGGFMNSHARR